MTKKQPPFRDMPLLYSQSDADELWKLRDAIDPDSGESQPISRDATHLLLYIKLFQDRNTGRVPTYTTDRQTGERHAWSYQRAMADLCMSQTSLYRSIAELKRANLLDQDLAEPAFRGMTLVDTPRIAAKAKKAGQDRKRREREKKHAAEVDAVEQLHRQHKAKDKLYQRMRRGETASTRQLLESDKA